MRVVFLAPIVAAFALPTWAQDARRLVDVTPADPEIATIMKGLGPDKYNRTPPMVVEERRLDGYSEVSITAHANLKIDAVVANKGNCTALEAHTKPMSPQTNFPFLLKFGDSVIVTYPDCVPVEVAVNNSGVPYIFVVK